MNGRTFAISRAVAIIGGTSALIVGATLASTTTNSVIANGTVAVSNNLTISQDDTTFADSASGFVFNTAPASPTVAHTTLHLRTTEPVNTVKLSGKITSWDPSLGAEAAHLTMNFKLGVTTVSVPFASLGAGDVSLATLGFLPNTGSTDNNVEAWVTADATAPVLSSSNGFALVLTGTSDGTVGP
jgi:hypothetical protein